MTASDAAPARSLEPNRGRQEAATPGAGNPNKLREMRGNDLGNGFRHATAAVAAFPG